MNHIQRHLSLTLINNLHVKQEIFKNINFVVSIYSKKNRPSDPLLCLTCSEAIRWPVALSAVIVSSYFCNDVDNKHARFTTEDDFPFILLALLELDWCIAEKHPEVLNKIIFLPLFPPPLKFWKVAEGANRNTLYICHSILYNDTKNKK